VSLEVCLLVGWDRILPELGGGYLWTKQAHGWAHVAVRQLEPSFRKRLVELLGVVAETLRDRAIDRIKAQCQIRRQHHREVRLARVMRIRNVLLGGAFFGHPLLRAGGALGQHPLVLEQVAEETLRPLVRRRGPGTFEAARNGVAASTGAERVAPAQT